MKDLLKQQDGASQSALEEKRKNQKVREEVELILSTGDSRTVENVNVIHEVDGWTLFETVQGEQAWVQDRYLVYYRDPNGGQ